MIVNPTIKFQIIKNKMKKILALIPAVLLIALQTYAQTATPGVTEKQVNQHQRIKEGRQSGELTKKEARRLRAREAKIQRNKRIAKSDGVVTKQERKKIHREQRRTSRAIYRQKHDAQSVPERK
jgi:hypothetical protein